MVSACRIQATEPSVAVHLMHTLVHTEPACCSAFDAHAHPYRACCDVLDAHTHPCRVCCSSAFDVHIHPYRACCSALNANIHPYRACCSSALNAHTHHSALPAPCTTEEAIIFAEEAVLPTLFEGSSSGAQGTKKDARQVEEYG